MKIQLDFNNKIISIEETVGIYDMMKKIKSILPDWKEWQLASNNSIVYWTNPVIWDYRQPYIQPIITTTGGNVTTDLTNNIYCLEVN